MEKAWDTKEQVEVEGSQASSTYLRTRYRCLCCREPVHLVNPDIKIDHFSHFDRNNNKYCKDYSARGTGGTNPWANYKGRKTYLNASEIRERIAFFLKKNDFREVLLFCEEALFLLERALLDPPNWKSILGKLYYVKGYCLWKLGDTNSDSLVNALLMAIENGLSQLINEIHYNDEIILKNGPRIYLTLALLNRNDIDGAAKQAIIIDEIVSLHSKQSKPTVELRQVGEFIDLYKVFEREQNVDLKKIAALHLDKYLVSLKVSLIYHNQIDVLPLTTNEEIKPLMPDVNSGDTSKLNGGTQPITLNQISKVVIGTSSEKGSVCHTYRKVYKIAKDFKVSSEALVQMLRQMGISVKSHMSEVDENLMDEIKKALDSERHQIRQEYEHKKDIIKKANVNLSSADTI